jgi:hypothetical protein
MKKRYTIERYQAAIKNLIKNKQPFQERALGSRRMLVVDAEIRATIQPNDSLNIGEITKREFASFLGHFSRNLNYCLKNERLAFTTIIFNGKSRSKNKDVWNEINEGDCFYNVDLKNAYWQIAHKLGYITTDFYERYADIEEYKQAKRYCISFLSRRNECVYFDGKDKLTTIVCDTTIYTNVYSNIRKKLYICINEAIESCNGEYVDYNIDAITVPSKHLQSVIDTFLGMGLEIKITRCFKANENQYFYGSKLKTFKK